MNVWVWTAHGQRVDGRWAVCALAALVVHASALSLLGPAVLEHRPALAHSPQVAQPLLRMQLVPPPALAPAADAGGDGLAQPTQRTPSLQASQATPAPWPARAELGPKAVASASPAATTPERPAAVHPVDDPLPASSAVVHSPAEGADERDTAGPTPNLPRYAVDVPDAFALPLLGLRNGQALEGEWRLGREADGRYASSLQLQTLGRPWLRLESQGPVHSHGPQPQRFEDHRNGRRARAEFDHEQGLARFAGRRAPATVSPLAQDRLSWMLQLISAVRADAQLRRPGAEVLLQVVGARGGSQVWRFELAGHQDLQLPGASASPGALHFVRQPDWPYDNRVELWLDAQRGFGLARLRLTQLPSGTQVDLWPRGEP